MADRDLSKYRIMASYVLTSIIIRHVYFSTFDLVHSGDLYYISLYRNEVTLYA